MLKIAMVAERCEGPDAQSRTPFLMALSTALADAGHEVTMHGRRDDQSTLGLGERIRAARPDVVHAHGWSVGHTAAAAARELGVPFVYAVHAPADIHAKRRDRDTETELTTVQAADHIIATYSGQVRRLRAAGVPRQQISVVPYGVDVDHFTPDGYRADGRLTHRLVGIGDVVPQSGFGTAVAALPALPDTELVIVGGSKRGTHAGELRDYARSLGVGDQVRLVGTIPRPELPDLLRSADLMVCSPREAAFGVGALEGMACGVAVVANGLGGLADTVVDRVTGTQVTPRKPRELAATLQRLLTHGPLREQQGAAGRDRAWARYSWARIAAETTHAYRRAGVVETVVETAAEMAEAGQR